MRFSLAGFRARFRWAVPVSVLLSLSPLPAWDSVPPEPPRFRAEVEDKESLRFQGVMEQQFDTSCGFSTLATLLHLYWGLEVSEKSLLEQAFGSLDELKPDQEYTTNLLLLQRLIEENGLQAKGFKMTGSELGDAVIQYGPIIVHYEEPSVHFALLLGTVDPGYYVLADPARGIELLSAEQLDQRRSPLVLLSASLQLELRRGYLTEILNRAGRRARILEGL